MDALAGEIRTTRPDDPKVAALLARHVELMKASSPTCSRHVLETDGLLAADVRFFVLSEAGAAVAMGALKRIAADHAELKSMHVAEHARGRGLARRMLFRLIEAAREDGHARVSLETGAQEVFAPARALYASAGFAICPPFEGYGPDPNSVFMTRAV